MYSDINRMPAPRRSGDDFLRRMIGTNPEGGCNMPKCGYSNGQPRPRAESRPSVDPPKCGESDNGCVNFCPKEIPAPSLAIVYSPRQCWRGIFSVEEALEKGTLFSELALPFYGSACDEKEGCSFGCNGSSRRDKGCTHGCKP